MAQKMLIGTGLAMCNEIAGHVAVVRAYYAHADALPEREAKALWTARDLLAELSASVVDMAGESVVLASSGRKEE